MIEIRVDVNDCEVLETNESIYYKYEGKYYIPYGCTPNGLVTLVEVEDKSIKLMLAYKDFNKKLNRWLIFKLNLSYCMLQFNILNEEGKIFYLIYIWTKDMYDWRPYKEI